MNALDSRSTLTVAAIMSAIAAIGELPPMPRIIVGFPLVGPNQVVECQERHLVLMGRAAFAKLKAHAVRQPLEDVYHLSWWGAPIEDFDIARTEHRALWDELWPSLAQMKSDESAHA